jgi:hypothetical protein
VAHGREEEKKFSTHEIYSNFLLSFLFTWGPIYIGGGRRHPPSNNRGGNKGEAIRGRMAKGKGMPVMHAKFMHELYSLLLHIPTYLVVMRCYNHVLH